MICTPNIIYSWIPLFLSQPYSCSYFTPLYIFIWEIQYTQMEIMKIDLREARSVNRTRESQRLQGRTCKVGEFRGIRRLFWPPGRTVSLPRQSGSRCIQGILRGLKIAHSQAKALARVSFVLWNPVTRTSISGNLPIPELLFQAPSCHSLRVPGPVLQLALHPFSRKLGGSCDVLLRTRSFGLAWLKRKAGIGISGP